MSAESNNHSKRFISITLFVFVASLILFIGLDHAVLSNIIFKDILIVSFLLLLGSFSLSNILCAMLFKRAIFDQDPDGSVEDSYIVNGDVEPSTMIFSSILSTVCTVIFYFLAYSMINK